MATPPKPDPTAANALPSTLARVLAFGAIIVAGVCGGLIGYGVADLQCDDCGAVPALSGVLGAALAAGGVAIVAVLTLRAMGEWRARDSSPP